MNQFSPLEYEVRTATAPTQTRLGRPVRRRRAGTRHAIAGRLHRLANVIDDHRLATSITR